MVIPSSYAISQKDILKYLGYRGSVIPDSIRQDMEASIAEVRLKTTPKGVYQAFPYEKGRLVGCSFLPEGEQISALLHDSTEVILLAVTLGAQADQMIRSWEIRNFSYSVILDTACSSAIEGVAEALCSSLAASYKERELYLTDRFSPGYGDMPLRQQQSLVDSLNASRRIGLTVTQSDLLVPRKSITAILGVSKNPQPRRHPGCGFCPVFYDCAYRKRGATCYE